jgi:hypothetical protein
MTDGQPTDMQRAVVCPHCGHVHPNRRVQNYSDFLDVCKAIRTASVVTAHLPVPTGVKLLW